MPRCFLEPSLLLREVFTPQTLFSPLPCFPLCREEVEKRFEGRLTKNMSGSLYEMVSRVMKALVNRKITVPGNFQG